MADDLPSGQIEYPYAPQPPLREALAKERPWPITLSTWWSPWMALIGVTSLMLWADFAVSPLMDAFQQSDFGAVWVYICLGIIPAQVGVLAAAICWGSQRFALRLICYWLAMFVSMVALLAGIAIGEGRREFDNLIRFMPLSAPLLVLAVQTPLWIVRLFFRWRIVRDQGLDAAAPEAPLSIRDLMVGTVLVAVSLAAARVAPRDTPDAELWIGWAIALASCGGVSLIALLPVSAWLLRQRNIIVGLILTAVYAVLAVVVTWIVIYIIDRNFWRNWWEMVGIAIMIVSFGATLALAALAARAAGLRLEIGQGREQAAVERDS